MVAKKKSQSKELTKPQDKALARLPAWKRTLLDEVRQDSAVVAAGGGNAISVRGGVFSYKGMPIQMPHPMIVIDYVLINTKYEGAFDEDNMTPPVCFAIGLNEKELVPHEAVPEPQAEACAVCPHNVFGTDARAKGKACGNRVRLAVISAAVEDLSVDYIEATEIAILTLSPTAKTAWGTYLKQLENVHGLAPQFAITDFDTAPQGGAFKVVPKFNSEIEDEALCKAILARRSEARQIITAPYDLTQVQRQPPTPTKKGARGKKQAAKYAGFGGGRGKR